MKKSHTILKVTVITVLAVLLSLVFLFFALRVDPYTEYSEGYFRYIVVSDKFTKPAMFEKKYVAIIDFTYEGKQQEVIDIPKELGGLSVRFIGGLRNDSATGATYNFGSENLKKVYIHENIERIYNGAFDNTPLEEAMMCTVKNLRDINAFYFGADKYYVYNSLLDSIEADDRVVAANIVFMKNYSTDINDGYYSLDNISEGEKIPVPSEPKRGGYEFTGWYTESECKTAWNFENSPTLIEGEEFRLYAGWRKL